MDDPRKPDKREQKLRLYLGRLKEHAAKCSKVTNDLLQYHVQFASLMARRIDEALESENTLKCSGPEMTKLASDISQASNWLSTYVSHMASELTSFVDALDELGVGGRRERSLRERFRRWLKSLLKAVIAIIATISPAISTTLCGVPNPIAIGCAVAFTALGQAASALRAKISGALLEHIALLQG